MKIIFLKDVGGVGRVGEVKEISDGYALNYLIPHRLAEQATAEKVAAHQKRMAASTAARELEEKKLAEAIRSLEGAELHLKVRATEKGGLFKSVTPKDITQAIADQKNAKIPEEVIALDAHIKQVGEHAIKLQGANTKATLKLAISAIQ